MKILIFIIGMLLCMISNAQHPADNNSVTDIDGNVYQTVQIGNQIWMAENLKVSKYNEGTPIPYIEGGSTWNALNTAAFCWYKNDSNSYEKKYGKLYNWYSLGSEKLCPSGWHVPTDIEWIILTDFLGGVDIAGGKLKEADTLYWKSPNTGATNESGFTALPGGCFSGNFANGGSIGYWWSTSNFNSARYKWGRTMSSFNEKVGLIGLNERGGYSVRCLKNNEDSIEQVDLLKGLVAYYPFNGNANDESGNGNNGVVKGATLTTDRFDNNSCAYYFNGQGNSITVSDFNIPASTTTVAFWVKNESLTGIQDFISKYLYSSKVEILIRSIADKYSFAWTIGDDYFSFKDDEEDFPIDTNSSRFDFLVLTYDRHQVHFYVNNTLIASKYVTGLIDNNNFPLVFGCKEGQDNMIESFNGVLDDIRIYNRVLNDLELKELYFQGNYPSLLPLLTTKEINTITLTTAICVGRINSIGNSTIISKGICWSSTPNPDTTDNKIINQSEENTYFNCLSGLSANTTYYIKAYAINSDGVGYGNELEFNTLPDPNFGSVTDIEGNVYKTIQIGTHNWMAENLKTTKFNDGSPIPNVTENLEWSNLTYGAYCWYNNDKETYKNDYGALYNYYAVIDNRHICPSNWHIPTPTEWSSLECHNCTIDPAAIEDYNNNCCLKEAGSLHWGNNYTTNETGFTALPGGIRQGLNAHNVNPPYGVFKGIQFGAFFWESTGDYYYISSNNVINLYHEWVFDHSPLNGYSIRCIEDIITTITIPDTCVFRNTDFEIPIYVHNLPNDEAISYQFDLNYNADILQYQNYNLEGTLSSDGSIQVNTYENKLSVAWAGHTPLADSGTILKLHFKALETGPTMPILTNCLVNTDTVRNIVNGTITINPCYGDVDDNGNIQAFDAALTLQYSVGLDPLPVIDPLPWEEWRTQTANVDGQDAISAYDASLMLQYTVGLINSFPAGGSKKSAGGSPTDVIVSTENGYIVFRSMGDFKGLNLTAEGNPQLLGDPQVFNTNMLMAKNISSSVYSVGLAIARSTEENEIIMKIPLTDPSVQSVILNLIVNNQKKQVNLLMPVSSPETPDRNIEMYPNPANTKLYFRNLSGQTSISIYDLQGREIIAETITDNQIDISRLDHGIYTIRIEEGKNVKIGKLIKQ